jgi:hypothetical protein
MNKRLKNTKHQWNKELSFFKYKLQNLLPDKPRKKGNKQRENQR